MNRRKFMSVIATSGIALSGLPDISQARRNSQSAISASDANIHSAIRELLDNGNIDRAKQLCEMFDVAHGYTSQDLIPDTDGSFSTLDAISMGEFDVFSLYLRNNDQNNEVWSATVYAKIDLDEWNMLDDANPKDAMSLTWSDTYYQPISQSKSNFNKIDRSFNSDLVSYQDYKTHGLWAKVDDNEIQNSHHVGDDAIAEVGFWTELERLQEDNKYNVNGEYLHNWNFGGVWYISSFSLGPAGIEFGGNNVDSWRKEGTTKPGF